MKFQKTTQLLKPLLSITYPGKHYVGIPVYSSDTSSKYVFMPSIGKYVDIDNLQEYNLNSIRNNIYVKGKILTCSNKDFNNILKKLKGVILDKISSQTNYKNIENMKYLKWCYDKILIDLSPDAKIPLNPRCICWVDFGQNIGSELRKLRPAILWRSSADKKMWTIIPLSTKCFSDDYYFHCDITSIPNSTAKIESIMNYSNKRIREPYFYNKKIAYISDEDYKSISTAIKRYYLFE